MHTSFKSIGEGVLIVTPSGVKKCVLVASLSVAYFLFLWAQDIRSNSESIGYASPRHSIRISTFIPFIFMTVAVRIMSPVFIAVIVMVVCIVVVEVYWCPCDFSCR